MQRLIKGMIATGALTVALALPAGAGARTQWVCLVDGQPVVFVSAADAARYGIETANSKAGVVFQKFGEDCSVPQRITAYGNTLETTGLSEQAMSEENVGILRRSYEEFQAAMERGDPGSWFDSGGVSGDFEWALDPRYPPFEGRPVWRGREGFVEFVRTWTEGFEDWSIRVEQLIDAGDDRVVALTRQSALGKGSGVPVELYIGQVWEVEGGCLARVTNYMSQSDALEAAGLSEQVMSKENIELVLKDLEYWNQGDIDAFVELWDDDVVLRAAEGWPERDFRGKAAVRSFYEGFAETVGRDSVIEDLIDAGDVVVTRMRAHMTGVQSGLEGDMRFSQVTTFREGKVVRAEFFWDHKEALEAAGLSE